MSKKQKPSKKQTTIPPITEQPVSRVDLLRMLADVLEWVAEQLRRMAQRQD